MRKILLLLIFLNLNIFVAPSVANAVSCRTIQNLEESLRLFQVTGKPYTNKTIDDNMKYYKYLLSQPECVSQSTYDTTITTTKGIQSDCKKFRKGSWEYKQMQVIWYNKWDYMCKQIVKIKV
jgi:hypothetical protein